MVTLTHSGDIVTTPNHAENYKRRIRNYNIEGKCRYGVLIHTCKPCIDFKMKVQGINKIPLHECYLSHSPDCPKYFRNYIDGTKKKTYKIKNTTYKTISARAAYLKDNAKNKVLFLTLTFGEWKQNEITEEDANKSFSKFIENLKHKGRGNYIAVRERGGQYTKRLHYHFICDLPFIPFAALCRAWNSAISDFCHPSARSVTSDPEARFIKSTVSAVRYICKYISKARNIENNTRVFFCSRDLAQAEIKKEFDNSFRDVLSAFQSIQVYKHNDFCWRYTISTPPGADKKQKKRSIDAANSFYYMVVRAWFPRKAPPNGRKNNAFYTYSEIING